MGREILRGKAVGNCGEGIDKEQARRALELLVDPTHRVELRPLPSARSVILPGNNIDALLEAADAAERNGDTVYLILNPVEPPEGVRACKDAHVPVRRWLFLDVDPERADGFDKACASDEEKAAAGALAASLAGWLADNAFPFPVQIDSGNGYYLLYPLDLPNDELTKALIKRLVKELKKRFDTALAAIDGTVVNASRLAKLPGTLNRKGENTAQRPHRRARIMVVPEELEVVPLEAIQAIAGTAAAGAAPSPLEGRATGGSKEAYGQKALREEAGRVLLAIPGPREGRNNALNRAAFSLGQLVGGGILSQADVETTLRSAASAAGLEEREIEGTLRSGIEAGKGEPRGVPDDGGAEGHAETPTADGDDVGEEAEAAESPVAYRASTVTPRKVEWLWPYRIPLGKLTTFAGLMGLGKTFLLCDLAARLSSGAEWPDLPGQKIEPADVLFISGEDDPEDTLVPRLIECGADLDRVWFLSLDELMKFTLASLKTLDKAASQAKRLKLVIVDPPTSYLGDVDDHKNAELRRLLTPLKHWTAERRCSSIFNTHLNKGGGQKVEAIFRVIGSVAWMAAVRAGHLIALDPDDPEKRLFVPMKSNLGRKPQALGYTIEDLGDDRGRVKWLGTVDVTADQAVNREKSKPKRVVASEWLVERFREKLEWRSDDLFAAAKQANVSRDAIFDAKDRLNIPKARKVVAENGNTCWIWWVPAEWEGFTQADGKGKPPAPDGEGEV